MRTNRDWLLLVKILGVAIYVGGLTAVLGIWISSGFNSFSLADPRRQLVLDQVSHLMVFLVVPALLVAIIFGIVLFCRMPGYFAKQRWMQVKLVSLLILIPSGHLYCRSQMLQMRAADDEASSHTAATQFGIGLALALAGSIWVVFLGRLKPQLGQSPATSSSVPSPMNRAATPTD